MATLECTSVETEGIALVGVRLAARDTERVTIAPTHEGPLWPPRRQGVPEAGWDGDRWSGTVHPERDRAIGYATSADVEEPAVEIVDTAPAGSDEADEVDVAGVVRALGDHRPPRDAVAPSGERPTQEPEPGGAGTEGSAPSPEAEDGALEKAAVPDLEAVEARLDRAESLATIDSAADARRALATLGGPAVVRDLAETLDADRAALSRLSDRVDGLAARAERVDVPASALARLA